MKKVMLFLIFVLILGFSNNTLAKNVSEDNSKLVFQMKEFSFDNYNFKNFFLQIVEALRMEYLLYGIIMVLVMTKVYQKLKAVTKGAMEI